MMQGSDHGEPHSLVVVDDVGEEFGGGWHRDPLLVPQLIDPATKHFSIIRGNNSWK